MRKRIVLSIVAFATLLLFVSALARISHGSGPSGSSLKNPIPAVKWSGTLRDSCTPSSEVPEFYVT